MMPTTFLWHDYETFGANTRRDRPAQFAAIRTDGELNAVSYTHLDVYKRQVQGTESIAAKTEEFLRVLYDCPGPGKDSRQVSIRMLSCIR